MIKEFNNIDEIEKYYDKESNTYIFKEDGEYIDLIEFNFDLSITSNIIAFNINACDINAGDINALDINARNIDVLNINARNIDARDIYAYDIKACDIKACDIDAHNINAWNIIAHDISYFALCFAYKNINCKSIKGRRKNAKHFVFDEKIEIKEETYIE